MGGKYIDMGQCNQMSSVLSSRDINCHSAHVGSFVEYSPRFRILTNWLVRNME